MRGMSKIVDNSGKTAKPRGRPFPKGTSGNPNGAPKRGASWKEILDEIGKLDGQQALERAGRIFAALKKYPKGVTLKELSAISLYIRLVNDPTGSLLNAIADRTDGKVSQPIEGNIGLTWSEFVKADEETSTE